MVCDTYLPEMKIKMVSMVRGCDGLECIEAAKAYALLCLAEREETVTTNNYIEGVTNNIFKDIDVPTCKITE